jgi:hypothetical protein
MQGVFMKFPVALQTRLGHRMVRVLFPVGTRNCSLPHNVHTDYGAHPAPCVTVPEILYPVLELISNQRGGQEYGEEYLHSPYVLEA